MQSRFTQSRSLTVLIVIFILLSVVLAAVYPSSNYLHTKGLDSNSGIGVKGSFSVGSNDPLPYNYNSEPAPMGIADLGIGYQNVPYSYSTSSFMGNIEMNSLSTFNYTQNSSAMTFQLNLNMVFSYKGSEFVYWVQNVAFYNTSTNQIQFIDNIWNLSFFSAVMHNSTVDGNGTIAAFGSSYFYFDYANNSLPGNNISLKEPANISLKMYTFLNNRSFPVVTFLYNDGYGWITYDRTVFDFGHQPYTGPAFVVNGDTRNPYGTYYDAELVLGGPGNSSQTECLNSNVTLSLEFYNGHNYQAIQNAFNYGPDTAETVNNVSSTGIYDAQTGQLFSRVSSGSGSLGLIYYSGELATLTVKSNILDGSLYVNDTNVTAFSNGSVTVSIFPGNYSIALFDSSTGSISKVGIYVLYPNESYNITKDVYRVEFLEKGLPSDSVWMVNITGETSNPITGSEYAIDLQNGTYNYTVSSNNLNYFALNRTGILFVNGSILLVNVTFRPVLFNVTFLETGLPSGASWSVTLNGKGTLKSNNSSVVFSLTNGTYDFVVPRVGEYGPSVSIGSVTVNGNGSVENVLFMILDGYLVGSVTPSSASLFVNGTQYGTVNGNFNISLPPGSYHVKFSEKGYKNYSTNITIHSLLVTHLGGERLIRTGDILPLWAIISILSVLVIIAVAVIISLRRR